MLWLRLGLLTAALIAVASAKSIEGPTGDLQVAESKHHEFEEGGGDEHSEDHFSKHGDKGEKGYKSHHEHEKGAKGHHDKGTYTSIEFC